MKILQNALLIFIFSINIFASDKLKQFKLLTFNTWLLDLPLGLGAKEIDKRIPLMTKLIIQTNADIVSLQEVWLDKHRDQLINGPRTGGYKYFYFNEKTTFPGVLGNG